MRILPAIPPVIILFIVVIGLLIYHFARKQFVDLKLDIYACNHGQQDYYFAVAKKNASLLKSAYGLSGWHRVQPEICTIINSSNKDEVFFLFAQKDASGNFAFPQYLQNFALYPPGFFKTEQPFCIKTVGEFTLEEQKFSAPDCPYGYTPRPFSLHIKTGDLKDGPYDWLAMYVAVAPPNRARTIGGRFEIRPTARYEISEKVEKTMNAKPLKTQKVRPVSLIDLPPIDRMEPRETRDLITRQIDAFNAQGYQIVNCIYGPYSGYGPDPGLVKFWYKDVPITRREVYAISENHPLRILGNVALYECPPNLYQAEILHKNSIDVDW